MEIVYTALVTDFWGDCRWKVRNMGESMTMVNIQMFFLN